MSVNELEGEPLFNGQSFATLLENVTFEQSTVATDEQNRRVVHLAARSSQICTTGIDIACTIPVSMVWLQTPWTLIRYLEKGHFKQHFDRSTQVQLADANVQTNCTVLLFPPAAQSPFEGGDLVLHRNTNYFHTIAPSTFQKWTMIIFLHRTEHTCTTIQKGTRYVFKTSAYIPDFPEDIDSAAFKKEGYPLD